MIDFCNLCLKNCSVDAFTYFSRESKDIKTGRQITDMYICELCIDNIKDDIYILSDDENLHSVPFKLLPNKHLIYYEFTKFTSRF
jgi:hypothetical protein